MTVENDLRGVREIRRCLKLYEYLLISFHRPVGGIWVVEASSIDHPWGFTFIYIMLDE